MGRSSTSTEWATLQKAGQIRLEREGFMIECQLDDDRLYLVTSVFNGGNYLPKSIRQCLQGHGLHALDSALDATLTIDEEHFRVLLFVRAAALSAQAFAPTIQDFLQIAHEWRHELDQHGQDDLVYVPAS